MEVSGVLEMVLSLVKHCIYFRYDVCKNFSQKVGTSRCGVRLGLLFRETVRGLCGPFRAHTSYLCRRNHVVFNWYLAPELRIGRFKKAGSQLERVEQEKHGRVRGAG